MDERPSREKNGEKISYYFTRDHKSPLHCALCRMNACVQKVEYCESWGEDIRVTHGANKEMS